jgi:hypothetical protein
MTKSEMIDAIENAKLIHLEQMKKIESEIAGIKIKNPTPPGKMDCECGIWFNNHKQIMQDILGMQIYNRLDVSHEKWHHDYINIYNLFFKEEKKGVFSKLFGLGEDDEMIRDKAKIYYQDLQKDTEELFRISDSALRRIGALSDSKFR